MPITNLKLTLNATIAAGGGFTLLSPAPGDMTATPLGQVGPQSLGSTSDLNGDGLPDLILGAPGDDDKAVDAGRVFVALGAAVPGSSQDAAHGTQGVMIIDGVKAGDMAGFAVGGIADMNGDGRGEILVGAPGMAVAGASDAGAGFVIWGQTAGPGNGVDLADPFAANGGGYAIKGQAAGDLAGWAMTSVGDMNGDGKADVLIGAPGQDGGAADAGAAYVVWGKTSNASVLLGNVQAGTGGFKITGAAAGDQIGKVLGALADQGGDGRAEVLLGSATASGGAGAVWVVDGQAGVTAVDLAALTSGYRIDGQAGEGAGASVSDAGDLDNDGLHDLLIGTANGNAAYLVYGQAGHANVSLADVAAGNGGVRISGGNLAGLTVLGNVDLNRDGVADLVLGTPHDGEGGANAGAVYVVWGDQLYRPIDLGQVSQGIGGVKIVGAAGSLTGSGVALGGDQDGDGTQDLFILSPGTGERAQILYTPDSWVQDANVYGTSGADVIGAGYGGVWHAIGAGNDQVVALGGADTVDTGAGNDVLDGGGGADSLVGGSDDDTYYLDQAGDLAVELAGGGIDHVLSSLNASLGAEIENLTLTGSARFAGGNGLNNVLTGTSVDNVLEGGAGNDTLIGGAGNDDYLVGEAGDLVQEDLAGGSDTIRSTISLTLAANVENLVLLAGATGATGNALGNGLTGNALANQLDGKAGADTMQGLAGDDSYKVDNSLDQVIEATGEGNDTVFSSVDFTLVGEVEALVLTAPGHRATGSAIGNSLTGTSGVDTLDGAGGADTMAGGKGNDSYVVDSLADQVTELSGGGRDTVFAQANWVLGAFLEDLVLQGAARSGTGNALANGLTGTAFADTLDGKAGADTMTGGGGDDLYVVDNALDQITEVAGGGKDGVAASVSFTLADQVENLTLTKGGLTGTGNGLANLLTGSAGLDSLVGLDGADTLDGKAGADTMAGGLGDDTYLVDNAGDMIVEAAGEGIDVAVLMRDGLTVDGDVEIIRLGGSAHSLTGGSGDNTLEGGSGNDSLDGGAGNDHILAGDGEDVLSATAGHDTLSGGSGDDRYHVHGASVEIEDFLGEDTLDASDSTGDDYIDLSGETDSEIENEVCHVTPGGTTSGPLDVQFLQDLTGSFADDIATVRGLVPQIVSAIQAVQANSLFGVSSFVDKPTSPFGAVGEWVYRQEQALAADAATLAATYARITNLNGMDAPESQLEALMQLALHSADVGYRADSARFVVLFTDAPFHVAGDGAAGGITTPNNGDAVMDGGGLGEDYPMIAQLAQALQAANIIPIFAIAGGFEATYQGLVNDLGRGTVVTLSMDSSNIVAAISAGMTAATTTHIEDADCGSGNDTVLGGVENNDLKGNAGADLLDGRAGHDGLIGGSGNDALTGGVGNDSLNGGTGDDRAVFTGNHGDYAFVVTAAGLQVTDLRAGSPDGTDLLLGVETLGFGDGDFAVTSLWGATIVTAGSSAAEVLAVADADHHRLSGLGGADTMTGGAGFDTLLGGGGNDQMDGGLGDDPLQGGAGADRLTGGAGADSFVFAAASESTRAQADLILDFQRGIDVIDLAAIDADTTALGDQAFSFIGGAAFGHHAGELRLTAVAGGQFQLAGDIDGDGVADLAIRLAVTSATAPLLADLLL